MQFYHSELYLTGNISRRVVHSANLSQSVIITQYSFKVFPNREKTRTGEVWPVARVPADNVCLVASRQPTLYGIGSFAGAKCYSLLMGT